MYKYNSNICFIFDLNNTNKAHKHKPRQTLSNNFQTKIATQNLNDVWPDLPRRPWVKLPQPTASSDSKNFSSQVIVMYELTSGNWN